MVLTVFSVILFVLDYFYLGLALLLHTSPLPWAAALMAACPMVSIAALVQAARGRSGWRIAVNALVLAAYAFVVVYVFLPWPDYDRIQDEASVLQGRTGSAPAGTSRRMR